MTRLTKDALLGANDLKEQEVDVPELGGSVLVRSLPAKFSNRASSQAQKVTLVGSSPVVTVDVERMEILQLAHGLVDPEVTEDEAEKLAEQLGPSFKRIITVIDEISGVDKEAIESAQARFQGSGDSGDVASGDDAPSVPTPTGAEAGQEPA